MDMEHSSLMPGDANVLTAEQMLRGEEEASHIYSPSGGNDS